MSYRGSPVRKPLLFSTGDDAITFFFLGPRHCPAILTVVLPGLMELGRKAFPVNHEAAARGLMLFLPLHEEVETSVVNVSQVLDVDAMSLT